MIEDAATKSFGGDQMRFTQGAQLLRDVRLAFAGQHHQVAHAGRAARQDFQDVQSFWMAQRLKEHRVPLSGIHETPARSVQRN